MCACLCRAPVKEALRRKAQDSRLQQGGASREKKEKKKRLSAPRQALEKAQASQKEGQRARCWVIRDWDIGKQPVKLPYFTREGGLEQSARQLPGDTLERAQAAKTGRRMMI